MAVAVFRNLPYSTQAERLYCEKVNPCTEVFLFLKWVKGGGTPNVRKG